MPADLQAAIEAGLTRRYGPGLTTAFADRPALIGGMRIQVGSDVYDGSVRAGLAALEKEFLRARYLWQTYCRKLKRKSRARRPTAAKQNVGIIREIGDGVAKIEGLTDAMLNEMIDLGHGITGLALNLEETEVGVIILGDYTQLKEGDEARTTGKLLQVPVGQGPAGPRREHAGRTRSTAKGRSRATSPIRSRRSRPASSAASRSTSRCRPASWRSTR